MMKGLHALICSPCGAHDCMTPLALIFEMRCIEELLQCYYASRSGTDFFKITGKPVRAPMAQNPLVVLNVKML